MHATITTEHNRPGQTYPVRKIDNRIVTLEIDGYPAVYSLSEVRIHVDIHLGKAAVTHFAVPYENSQVQWVLRSIATRAAQAWGVAAADVEQAIREYIFSGPQTTT